jgi:two-component system response regulator
MPVCNGDPALLEIVWTNLLANAIKFTAGREPARITVGVEEVDGNVAYFVRDNGVGFDMTHAAKLFGVFERPAEESSRAPASAWRRSSHLQPPWRNSLGESGARARGDFLFHRRRRKTMIERGPVEILLVEDNQSDAKLTQRALVKNNIVNRIEHVRDGQAAIDYLFRQGEYSDRDPAGPRVVLLDIKLPKVDGLEVLRRIRADARTASLPVVLLTSSNEERDIVRGYSLHANSYIVKPVDFLKFTEAVRSIGLSWLLVNTAPPTPDLSATSHLRSRPRRRIVT